ncbi:MAG: YlxR family protein [Deltaproteobacteria bacterium]|nr:YlxR family protein [Deltaproteobacteria bacterium]
MPTRRCLFCFKVRLKSELFRVVVKDGAVMADKSQTLPGRGAYLCKNIECVVGGCKRGFSKAFKATLPPVDSGRLLAELGFEEAG